ncbi:hypothetical protein AB0383_19690 [Amycolatopsis sp. NPDC051373]|uniref:hypothetical protein n=1 Tax=Amycolatopsis sp. NPDC051373 TaxID=3155801 RepID=UPI00345035A3
MTGNAYRKLRYATWDGSNLGDFAQFLPGAYVQDGNVFIAAFGGAQVTYAVGNVIVELVQGPGFDWFETEADFLAAYNVIPEE